MAFLLDVRLKKACYLIETTFTQIKQIGIQTGLVNKSHLTRDFKSKYGMTPVEYRKRHWETVQRKETLGNK
jgi:transcriptional regulator GlxA family with amidase domain